MQQSIQPNLRKAVDKSLLYIIIVCEWFPSFGYAIQHFIIALFCLIFGGTLFYKCLTDFYTALKDQVVFLYGLCK